MKRLWQKIRCFFGMHYGWCEDGAYHCHYCDFVEPYDFNYSDHPTTPQA